MHCKSAILSQQMKFAPSVIIYGGILMDQNEKFSLKHSLINFSMLEYHSYTLQLLSLTLQFLFFFF